MEKLGTHVIYYCPLEQLISLNTLPPTVDSHTFDFIDFPYCELLVYEEALAAISFDPTGATHVGKYLVNHSFQLAGFITTIVSISLGALIVSFMH